MSEQGPPSGNPAREPGPFRPSDTLLVWMHLIETMAPAFRIAACALPIWFSQYPIQALAGQETIVKILAGLSFGESPMETYARWAFFSLGFIIAASLAGWRSLNQRKEILRLREDLSRSQNDLLAQDSMEETGT